MKGVFDGQTYVSAHVGFRPPDMVLFITWATVRFAILSLLIVSANDI